MSTNLRLLPSPATTLSRACWIVAEATVYHFSEFRLTGARTPLPTELTRLKATAEGAAAVRLAGSTTLADSDVKPVALPQGGQ